MSITEIVSLVAVKSYLKITGTDDDDELQAAIDTAALVIESYVGKIVEAEYTEKYDGNPRGVIVPKVQPVLSITSVTESTLALTQDVDFVLDESGILRRTFGALSYQGWFPGIRNVVVVYKAGLAAVPANYAGATKELVRVNFRPQLGGNYSPFDGGDADDYAATGDQVRLGFYVPGRVLEMLGRQHVGQSGPV